MTARESCVELEDGRELAFREVGPEEGRPVLLFHGAPGSRLLCPDEQVVAAAGVRLVVIDRPGYGLSDARPGRVLLEWPDDVSAVADALEMAQFAVIGWSAGAAHALACGAAIPDRLTAIVIVSSGCSAEEVPELLEIVPGMSLVYEGAQTDRLATEVAVGEFFASYAQDPRANWYDSVKGTFPNDRVFAVPSWDQNFLEHVVEGLRPGIMGYASDQVVCGGPWGFRLSEVEVPVIHRYGDRDLPMTLASVDAIDAGLPACSTAVWADTGHAGIYENFGEVLQLAQ